MRISESQIPLMLPYVCHINSDEVTFLGKTYQPQTLRFINFIPNKSTPVYYYGVAKMDFQVSKAIGDIPFTPLQELVHG